MSTEKMREEFEVACESRFSWSLQDPFRDKGEATLSSWDGEQYGNLIVQGMWWAWQASRAAIEVELPSLRSITMGRRENEHDSGFNAGVEMCIDAIESLGLKVKP